MPAIDHLDLPGLRCEWLWVYDASVPGVETWSKEILVPPGVFFVLKGMGRIQAGDRELELPQGTAFFSAPGMRRQWFERGTRLLSVGFRATWPDGLPLFKEGLDCAEPAARLRKLHLATRQLYRSAHGRLRSVTYREATRPSAPSLAEWCRREASFRAWFAVYIDALARLGVPSAPGRRAGDERMGEIIRRLDAWPLSKPLVVAGIAAGLDCGERRLEQLLAAELGLTPHAHLNRRRIEAARRLLAGTSTPLKQIAHELGLRHASHFTKWFRRHAGMTPSAYRDCGGDEAA